MLQGSRVRVYIACSLDGFIAGTGDDLSWLPGAVPEESKESSAGPDAAAAEAEPGESAREASSDAVGYEAFIAEVGALLMGRRTYDMVVGFGGEWPYGDKPVLVATRRPLESSVPTVRAVGGDVREMVDAAKRAAGGKDVYVDGGNLIRQALDVELVDEMIVTMVPVLLGEGHPLFAGVSRRHQLEFLGHAPFGDGMLQVRCRPRR